MVFVVVLVIVCLVVVVGGGVVIIIVGYRNLSLKFGKNLVKISDILLLLLSLFVFGPVIAKIYLMLLLFLFFCNCCC